MLIDTLSALAQLTPTKLAICAGVVFLAAVVRGFAGFALSALIMAGLVVIIPPVQLIPVCFLLEATASLMMFRGGLREADMQIVIGLVLGSAMGMPAGLYATNILDIETSKLIVLCLLVVLASAQLFRIRLALLATKPGLYLSGFAAGIATGLASVGGMVVALYALSQDIPAKRIRGSLVMYLFFGMFTSAVFLFLFGMLERTAVMRALLFAPAVITGVLLGSWLFRPSLESFYKRFCLILLISLSFIGITRVI